jgi:hypothetical protein
MSAALGGFSAAATNWIDDKRPVATTIIQGTIGLSMTFQRRTTRRRAEVCNGTRR